MAEEDVRATCRFTVPRPQAKVMAKVGHFEK